MNCEYLYADLVTRGAWDELRADIDPDGRSGIVGNLLETLRSAGAVFYVEESSYIDRDFSAAFSTFYSTLFHMRPRHCRRFHFFSEPAADALEAGDSRTVADALQARQDAYLGFIVVRPLRHAPVGTALLSTRCAAGPGIEISVRSTYRVHFLGAELEVEGVPVTEQDARTGSCAQATIWTAGRHFHNQYSMPWFSVPDITEAALKPTDSILASSLPAGSEHLTDDNMVRALRAMGEHPIVYAQEEKGGWAEPPERTVARYLDSGIPVIIGIRKQNEPVGHAVVAVGSVMTAASAAAAFRRDEPTMGDGIVHLLVNDDQSGAYRRLPVSKRARSRTEPRIEDVAFLIVPLPPKVFLKAEVAETLARDKVKLQAANRANLVAEALPGSSTDWSADPAFYASPAEALVARTYLTHGWKYKHRLMRNAVPEELKRELSFIHLPRYVWVTEFSLPEDVTDLDPCCRRVRAHVVVDATGSRFEDSVVMMHLPGIVVGQSADPARPAADGPETILRVLSSDAPYFPKIRGRRDFDTCTPPAPPGAAA